MAARFPVLLLGLLLATAATGEPAGYGVEIQPGVTPRMSPSGVAAYILAAARTAQAEVRLVGRFVNHHTGGLGAPSVTHSSASYVIDDETGELLAYGTSGGGGGRSIDPDRLTKGR